MKEFYKAMLLIVFLLTAILLSVFYVLFERDKKIIYLILFIINLVITFGSAFIIVRYLK